ncbi:MAG: hypothetical protein ACR2FM_04470 [Candidatus Saccharimonadales bacterium]
MARKLSAKRIEIDKAQLTILVASGAAAFVIAFCMVAGKSLLDQRAYQARVIGKKQIALKQVKSNAEAYKKLNTSFEQFDDPVANILGGNPAGTGDKDGDNARIVLDALPSKYDFPALTTSVEKIFKDNGFQIKEIIGTDDEVAQSQQISIPQPVELPFSVKIGISGTSGSSAVNLLERSIRPIQVKSLTFKVEQGEQPELTINAKTFYQPSKIFKVETEQIR